MTKPRLHAKIQHRWDLSPQAAIALQIELAPRVICESELGELSCIAGIDASYRDGMAFAAIVVLSYPALDLMECAVAERPVEFPYVPGLLSFREAPAVLDALGKLETIPDLLIFDGHGLAHPRRLGIASHIGLVVDAPSIGCAKRRLCGHYEDPGPERGQSSDLLDGDVPIGAVVRTRTGVQPIFVSIGHRVDLATAVETILACGRGYRLPEPTRLADRLAGGRPLSTTTGTT